jgi:hypothetical protein
MDSQRSNVLLSTAYLAPIQYFTKLISYRQIFIEYWENYLKQSYRNRTIVLAANGPLQLTLPIVDGPRAKGPIRDQKLSYDYNWQQMHWRGICSAYNNSPYFEYYSDDLASFFHQKKWKFLADFNLEIQNAVLIAINFDAVIMYTRKYWAQGNTPETVDDFRYSIHPKTQKQSDDDHFTPTPYTQVFQEKWGFVPNLSILDLLFNEGPSALSHLQSCISQ